MIDTSRTQIADVQPVDGLKVTTPAGIDPNFLDLGTGAELLLNAGVLIAVALLVVLVAYGGITYLMSGGNEETANRGKRILQSALIGFIAILGTWSIVTFFFNLIGYGF